MLGNNSNSGYEDYTTYFLRPITQDKNKNKIDATFQVTKVENGEYIPQEENVSSVTGHLTKVDTYSKEWNGKDGNGPTIVTKGYRLFLRDDDAKETYIIDAKLNILTRDLINKIITLTSFDEKITISLYKNKSGFNSSFVKVGNSPSKWKFERKDIPTATAICHPKNIDPKTGKPQVLSYDYEDVDNFFIEAIEKFISESNFSSSKKSVVESAAVEDKEVVKVDDPEGDFWEDEAA